MKLYLKLFIVTFFFFFSNELIGQSSFHIRYHIKLFNENGNVFSCDSLAKDSIYIYAYPGKLVNYKFSTESKYLFIDIYTMWPAFTLIWEKENKMIFTVDCATEYKDIYLDSLYFEEGRFIVDKNCRAFKTFEDEVSRHIIFSDYSQFKESQTNFNKNKDLLFKINCR
jgi:hypothetical protein